MKAVREDTLIDAIYSIDPDFPVDKLAENLLKNHGYVLFKCDGERCDGFCNTDYCHLTSEISHASDFEIILSDDKPFIVQQKTGKYTRGEQIIRAYSGDKITIPIGLTENEYQAAVYLSKKSNISMSDLFRRGVDLLNARELKIDLSDLHKNLGIIKN